MTQPRMPKASYAGLIWRMASNVFEVLLVQRPKTAPTGGGFWDFLALPQDHPALASPMLAGSYPTPAWSPHGRDHQVVALTADQAACTPEALAAYDQHAWVQPATALCAHAQGLYLMSLPVLASLRALTQPCAKQSPQARVQAAAHALQHHTMAVNLREAYVPGVLAMPLLSPTLPPATHTNCYLLGQNALTVVDPGTPYPADMADFLALLAGRVAQGATISQVWISHFHADHVGAAMQVKERFGATIMAHADTADALRGRVTIDTLVADDAQLDADGAHYTALHTPGHAKGHLSFYAHQGGHLLSGDNILGTGTPIVPPAPHGSMRDYMASLRRVLALPLGMLFPGHGPPCAFSAQRAQDTLKARLQREALLIKALGTATTFVTLDALVAQVYRGLGHGLQGLAELATLAHLEKLVADGAVDERPATQDAQQAWRLPLAGAVH